MIIRKGTKEDVARAFELVEELALFEKAPEEVTNNIEMMMEDGFGANPIFEFIVAELDGEIIGMSLYYWRYSTWKGKRLYLEDLIVTELKRGIGAGKKLFERTVEIAKEEGATGMMWQVLDWNTPAIEFYKKYGADIQAGWHNCHLSF